MPNNKPNGDGLGIDANINDAEEKEKFYITSNLFVSNANAILYKTEVEMVDNNNEDSGLYESRSSIVVDDEVEDEAAYIYQ